MKNICILLLAVLLLSCASAQTREGVIMREGEEDPILETLFVSDFGFSFWYDTERFAPDDEAPADGAAVRMRSLPGLAEAILEFFPAEEDGALPALFPDPDAPGPQAESGGTESGAEIVWISEVKGGTLECRYGLRDGGHALAARSVCPLEAAEGLGKFLERMVFSVFFGPQEAVRVCWLEELPGLEPAAMYAPEDAGSAAPVVFIAREAVTELRLLSLDLLDFDEDGGPVFAEEVVYEQDALTPEEPLAAALAFWGDLPNNGLAYVDAEGVPHRFALDISGENGSLILWEYGIGGE